MQSSMAIFSIIIFGIHIAPSYYGLMYALGFTFGYLIIRSRNIFTDTELDSLVFHVFLWVLLGWRLGYILFYNLPYYLHHPLDIIKTWQGGMSFHGGVIGVIIAMLIFARKEWVKNWLRNAGGSFVRVFLKIADQVTSILPIGLGLGRIGNYLNMELLGFSEYTWPLRIIKDGASYFPSTLLEAVLEGPLLFTILYYLIRNKKFDGQVATAFLVTYGVLRFIIEFVRTPDANIGYIANGWLTMGHILSIPMILIGWFLYWVFRKKRYNENIS